MMEDAQAALAALDAALAEQPHADWNRFSAAARHLSRLRDALVATQRRDGETAASRRQLEHVNAVISVVLAAHFPLGAIPWDEVKKARGWLAKLAA